MRVLIEREPSRPLVAVVSVVDVGGTLDPPGKEGLAHLVEHLTFRSVQDRKHPLNDLLEMSGAASWNASTEWDVTTYHSIGAKDSLPALLTLEAARLVRPLEGVTPEVFEAERQVVKNELFQRDEQGLESVIFNRLSSAVFPKGHPNSRPVAGTETSIAALSLEDAREFVKRYYRPERVTLLIAGDVDPASLSQLLGERIPPEFVDAPASGPVPVKSRLPAKLDEILDPVSPRDLIRVQAPAEVPLVVIGWALPSGFDKEGYLDQFVARLASRAAAVAVAHDPDLVGVGTTLIRGRSGSMLLCFGRLRDGSNPARSAEAMLDQLFRTWAVVPRAVSLSDQVRGQESAFLVQRNKAYVGLASELEHFEGRAVMRAQLVHATGEVNAVSREMQSIGQLSAGQVASFANRYLDRGRARIVFLEPNGAAAAEDEGRGAFASSTGLQLRVDREVLLKRVVPPSAEIRAFRMDSGLEVVLARRPTAPVLSAALAVRGGSADGEPLGGPIYARFAGPVDTTHGYPDLYGMLPSNQVARDQLTVQLLAANGNLANAVGILLDRARSLHVDSGIDSYVDRELRSVYRKDWVRPHEAFDRLVWSAIYDKHPYGRVVPPDQFEKVSSSEAQQFLDRALVPASAVLAIAGDLDLSEGEAVGREYFGGWRPKTDRPAFLTAPLPSGREGAVPVLKLARPGAR
ncbi:MAG TPA: insulinase family protein, partial [Myxococcaceae bacterium]|nr:insulinase family protein [Myxococcaceae bacterium]